MPRVSVLVAAYEAERTYRRSLRALQAQQYQDFELIVIETGPASGMGDWLASHWPAAIYLYDVQPRKPHDALNRAVQYSEAELLAFTDIDAYPATDWLSKLTEAYDQVDQPVVGGVECHGRRWIDLAAHFVKFDKWLAGLPAGWLDEGPTVNMLIPRADLQQGGGFRSDTMHADTELSWRLQQQGYQIRFSPEAIVKHHHLHSWASLLVERYQRGASFAEFMVGSSFPSPQNWFLRALIGILPLRLVSQFWRVSRNAISAGLWFELLISSPAVVSGLYAWLLGESLGYLMQGKAIG